MYSSDILESFVLANSIDEITQKDFEDVKCEINYLLKEVNQQTITIPLKEYQTLLEIKGRYMESKNNTSTEPKYFG